MRLKSSEGRVRSWSPARLATSSAPVPVSRVTRTSPGGLNARTYATASAASTVWSISSNGMPTSAHSAVRASARLSVDGSDCDREPARDNVIPRNVNYYRRSPARAHPGYRDARRVDRDQLPLDHRFGGSAAIADVDSLAVERFVVAMTAEGALRARRGHLEVVWPVYESRVIEQRTGDAAHALTILDSDWFGVVDRHAQCPSRLTRLLKGVELVAHVVQRGLEQLSYRRYGPCRHVGGLESDYRRGWSFRQTTSRGAALKIELYVPDTIPIRRASAKPFKESPPATRIATRTRMTVKLVMIERTAVCMMLRFTTWSNESLWLTRRFSRIRSKTTMVSWTEKPTTVSTAVTNKLLISPILR